MYNYSVKIRKVSGRLNESVLPQKNLVVKSKSKLAKRNVLKKAAKYLFENYGLDLIDAVIVENAPRLNSSDGYEREAAMNAQSNHRLTRPNVSLKVIRDRVTKELARYAYSKFNEERRELWYHLPDGVIIRMDGEVELIGSSSGGYSDAENASHSIWKDQSYDADLKASENVYSYYFDSDEDFKSLLWFKNDLDEEISNVDYDYDDEDEEMTQGWSNDAMRIDYEEELESMENVTWKIAKFDDIEKAKSQLNYNASHNVLDELKQNVTNVIKDYIKQSSNSSKVNSSMGMKKMERKI